MSPTMTVSWLDYYESSRLMMVVTVRCSDPCTALLRLWGWLCSGYCRDCEIHSEIVLGLYRSCNTSAKLGKAVSISIIAQNLHCAISTCSVALSMTQISHGELHSHRTGYETCPYGASYHVVADHM